MDSFFRRPGLGRRKYVPIFVGPALADEIKDLFLSAWFWPMKLYLADEIERLWYSDRTYL
jgi:hypothetical protein